MTAEAADRSFFHALTTANLDALEKLRAPDFILVDVMRGGVIPRDMLLIALASRQVSFDVIEPADVRVREYGDTAVINGRTTMMLTAGGDAVQLKSRYTHVYIRQGEGWVFVSAQGTPIAE